MAILSISRPALACLLLWLALSKEATPQARKGPDCKNPKTILDFIKEVKVEVEENGVKLDSNGEKIEEVKEQVEENGVTLDSNAEKIEEIIVINRNDVIPIVKGNSEKLDIIIDKIEKLGIGGMRITLKCCLITNVL